MQIPDLYAVFLHKLSLLLFVTQKQRGAVPLSLMVLLPNRGDHHHLKLHVLDQKQHLL
jgi:hypothetical protein